MPRAGISGYGVCSALGRNAQESAANLTAARSPVLPAPPRRFETKLDLPVFEIDLPVAPGEEELGFPLRFLLHAFREALARARLTPEELPALRVGVAVGTTVACQLDNIPCHARMRTGDLSDLSPLDRYIAGMPAEYLRRRFRLNGPAITVSNACASGADAAVIALDWLRSGLCDLAFACGCDSVSKVAFNGFHALRVSSHAPCRPFDKNRSGLNLGDGAGVLVLETPASAARRGVAQHYEIGGTGKTADAFHITQPEGSGAELERAVRQALDGAGLAPSEIEFVNAHGTGTPANDRVEGAALARIFGDALHYHSTKAMTGHTLGAAGAMEAVFTLLMLENRRAAPSHRCDDPDPELPVPPIREPLPVAGSAALSTSLAFGGSNTALAIRRIRSDTPPPSPAPLFIGGFRLLEEGAPDRDTLVALCRKYKLRRPDRLTQLALGAAEAIAELPDDGETALITVSAYGPANTTIGVLDDILDYPEDEILPTGFSHSVVNAAASYLGAARQIHGPTFAVTGFEDPFYEAATAAAAMLAAKRCRRVLIVAADEKNPNSEAAKLRLASPPPLRDEGACALLVTADPNENRLGRLELADADGGEARLLACGIPEGWSESVSASTTEAVVTLRRLDPPRWKF